MEGRNTMRVAMILVSMVLLLGNAVDSASASTSASAVHPNKLCGIKCSLKCIWNPRYQTCYNHCMFLCKHPHPGDHQVYDCTHACVNSSLSDHSQTTDVFQVTETVISCYNNCSNTING